MPRLALCGLTVLLLLTGGCTRQGALISAADLVGRVQAPDTVAGYEYSEIRAMGGLRDECLVLSDVHRRRGFVRAADLQDWLVPECEAIVAIEQARIAEQQAIAELVAREWAIIQHRLEIMRREEAHQRRLEREAREAEETAARELQALRDAVAGAAIWAELQDVEDKPLAHTQGQPSEVSLKNFLACVELAYPNQGYDITRSNRNLSVIARRARLPRGEMPIEARFVEYPGAWLMSYLKGADIEPRTAADRYVLSENLLAERCHSDSGVFFGNGNGETETRVDE